MMVNIKIYNMRFNNKSIINEHENKIAKKNKAQQLLLVTFLDTMTYMHMFLNIPLSLIFLRALLVSKFCLLLLE